MQLNEKFLAFDTAHPDVWALFETFSIELIGRGRKHGSSDAVMHRIRWNYETSSENGAEHPKLNNIFSACYARKFHRQHPQHDGFFFTRHSQADPQPHEMAHTANEAEPATLQPSTCNPQ